MRYKLLLTLLALTVTRTAVAQITPEDAIKWRQSGYSFMAWNMTRIKMNLEGTYNKEEVVKAANAIQAIANSGMGALFIPGSETGTGWEKTRVKPELFSDKARVTELAINFNKEANELAKVVASADAAAVQQQLGKLGGTCKACHDDFKIKD